MQVTGPDHLAVTRAAYDAVAVDYAAAVPGVRDDLPLDRAMLTAYAEEVLARDAGPVVDLGCGPGRITAYLRDQGLDVFGVDLSPGMIAVARRAYPDLRFETGSMTTLDVADGSLRGIVAWYSIIHTPPSEQGALFAGFRRALAPGGRLLLAFQAGDDERIHREQAYGHEVSYDVYRLSPDRVVERLRGAGLAVRAQLVREPEGREGARQAFVSATVQE